MRNKNRIFNSNNNKLLNKINVKNIMLVQINIHFKLKKKIKLICKLKSLIIK